MKNTAKPGGIVTEVCELLRWPGRLRVSGDDGTRKREDHYGGRAYVCACMASRCEMPLMQSSKGGGSKRFQGAQNFYGIEMALRADIGEENHAAVRFGAGGIFRLDGDKRERTALARICFTGIGGRVFVIVDCSGAGRDVRLGKLEGDSYSCLCRAAVEERGKEGPGADGDETFFQEGRFAAHDLDVREASGGIDEGIEHDFAAEKRLRRVGGRNQRERNGL